MATSTSSSSSMIDPASYVLQILNIMCDSLDMQDVGRLWLLAATTIGVCSVMGICMSWVWRSLLIRVTCYFGRGPRNMPPGPAGLPIIGHLHKLGALPHQTFARLSKIHGPLMCVRLGGVPVVVASSPTMAMHILQTHDKSFAGRPQHLSATHIINGCPNILFSQPGPYWKLMRQICTSDLLSTKRLDHFRPMRALELGALLRSVFAAQGSPLLIREKLHSFSSDSISRMTLGKPLHQLVSADPNALNIEAILTEILHLLGAFNLGDFIPFLAWMDLQGYGKRSKEVARKLSSVFQAVIDARRTKESSDDAPPRDFLDLLLLAAADAQHKDLQIEDSNIRAVLLEMFSAGTDTSAITVEWALAELLANPEKLRRVQEELDAKVGTSRIVQETDLPDLPYLRATVNETLRLHPVAPLLAPHMSLEACDIAGYHIPANTDVYINAWAIHTDPSVWPDPLAFRPERFLDCSTLLDAAPGQQFEYLPFGSGRRSCPGWKLSLLTVQNVLGNLLHAFDWTTPASHAGTPPNFNEEFGIVVALEHPLIAVPLPRLPRHLYDVVL